jgi:hypothetical protein
MPAGFDSSGLRIESSLDGQTFQPVFKDGADLLLAAAPAKHIIIDPVDLISANWWRLVAEADQAAERTITLILRAL